MKKQFAQVLIPLLIAFIIGTQIGKAAQPESFQLKGKLSFDPAQVPSADYEVGDFIVKWRTDNGGQLTVESKDRPGFAVWQTVPGEAFVMAARVKNKVTENRGMFHFDGKYIDVCQNQIIDSVELVHAPSGLEFFSIGGNLQCSSGKRTSYSFSWFGWGFEIDTDFKNVDTTFLTYASTKEEHFFGFGEQFTNFDMKGKRVPIWLSEQGVGRGEEPITTAANITNGGAGGSEFTSYAPMPFFISSKMYSFNSTWPDYLVFDFTRPERVQITAQTTFFIGEFNLGETPEDLISNLAQYPQFDIFLGGSQDSGKMTSLPEWIYKSAIVGMQGGTEKVQDVYKKLQIRETPISAFWLQDWVGQRTTSFGKQLWWNWEVDNDRYPNWDNMVTNFNENDIQVMVYVSPYLADIGDLKSNMRRNLFQEAKEKGYLVQTKSGAPYLILNTDFYFGMIDLSNPEAFKWYKQVIKEQVVSSGASGWMADFGESLPYDAVVYDDKGPAFNHNLYPVRWAKLNREIVDEAGKDLVFFNRAAYSGSPQYATLFWEGDQLVDWSAEDGIKSAVTGLNTSGLSGMAFNHSDIGGYTTISNPVLNIHRSRELLYRWMEMNAFTLIFRTHEGNQPDNNVQFYTDDETLDTFAYWAKVYAALFEYRKSLVQEATETGLPVVRHPFIHYPDDPETWKITYQEFMLGADFLIAPVTDEGATEVTAYLPAGTWTHLWSGKEYQGGQYVTVPAPIGKPGVFYLSSSNWGKEFAESLKTQGLMP
jgi:alpha-glucosidase